MMDGLKSFFIKPIIKVVVLGDSGVGKTAIVNRFTENYYSPKNKATVGVDFKSKDILFNNVSVTLQIWDTAGEERFRSLGVQYFRGADCCILVFDTTNKYSFSRLQYWKEEFLIQANPLNYDDFPFIVIGNKIDDNNRLVPNETINEWRMRNKDTPYFEVSAKEDLNIQAAFNIIPKVTMQKTFFDDKYNKINLDVISLQKPEQNSKNKRRCCC
ncbi:Ras-related protein Rab-7a [Strongyloides ratti]|uniref:Ras-related protein Rab-7b n=1 Tax=Strongyloides ratti TaxID=34506 RepID=A0A090L8X7_STRRB|nr:Ras-related protein Rab-7a [Strongyloides ratti]CEF63975.1 Ras-related protein Rab-7a [Strongyloides ratti]